MKKTINVEFSTQASDLLDNMHDISKEEIIEWFSKQTVLIGGGNIIDYMAYLKKLNGE